MNSKKSIPFIIGAIAVIIILMGNPFFVLVEGRQAIITQFGEPIGEPFTKAGLHLKIPFIQKVVYFEKRVLEWDGYPTQIPTKDKRYIWVDTTARWQIKNPLEFLKSVADEQGAHARLDDILDAAVRDAVTTHKLIDIVRTTNRMVDRLEKTPETKSSMMDTAFEKIKGDGREEIRKEVIATAKKMVPQYGISLLDVQIKRVNYVEEVKAKVYERMIAERKRAAEEYRSTGRGKRAEIEGKTEKKLKEILSGAYKKAQVIKGAADADSTDIYAKAYSVDPEFYSFLKTLETYKNTIDEKTTLILNVENEYFHYLQEISSK